MNNKKEADYLYNFYGLPKVHKSSEIKRTIKQIHWDKASRRFEIKTNHSRIDFEDSTFGHFLELILKLLCETIPSYPDMDFHNHIPSKVPTNTSFDVISLYTNIWHDLRLTAVKFWVDKELVDGIFNTEYLLTALQIVWKGNTFDSMGTLIYKLGEWPCEQRWLQHTQTS